MNEPPFERLGIVGLGLIGGSIALAARAVWPSSFIAAVDRREVLDEAIRRDIVDRTGGLEVLSDVDLIVLAAPIRQNQEILEQLPSVVKRPTVVTDTGSTKREIVAVGRTLPPTLSFIGGHPLGGAAAGGLAHACADLFANRAWILTPSPESDPGAVEKLEQLARAVGAIPARLDALEHDRLLAFVSHLPQLAASALMHVIGRAVSPEALVLSGRGLADTTRLAASPAAIWKDIAGTNADQIGPALDALIAVLQDLRGDLCEGDRLLDIFGEAARSRARLAERTSV